MSARCAWRPVLVALLAAAPVAFAQTGQQKYTQWCQGCHGSPANNLNGVLAGKDWNYIKLAIDTKLPMTEDDQLGQQKGFWKLIEEGEKSRRR